MKKLELKDLPYTIISPISGDTLVQTPDPNDNPLSVAQFFDNCTECFDVSVVMYLNSKTNEIIYIPYGDPNI